nr:putative speedy protein E7 [Equus asinus]
MEGKTEVSSRQKDPWKEAQESSFCLAKKAPRKRSPLASSSTSLEAVPQQRTRRRGQKRKRPTDVKEAAQESSSPASNSTPSEAVSELKSWKKRGEKRNIWTVNHVEGTKLRMNKRRRPSYRPEDQEAFYRLLEDPVIQSFLEADIFLKVSDKYLLSMVVEYFGRVGLPGHLYNRIHFFLALYIASDMEEDNPMSKRSIFQFLLGREHWPDLYKEFLKLKVEFFYAMGFRAWVTPELCEEIQAQNPHHWVWSRVRQCAP